MNPFQEALIAGAHYRLEFGSLIRHQCRLCKTQTNEYVKLPNGAVLAMCEKHNNEEGLKRLLHVKVGIKQ